MGKVRVIQVGLFSTIQDFGRFGFRKYGVPEGGAMDRYALKICNLLLGNSKEAAVLEITLQGPVLEFDSATAICLSGANLNPEINGAAISMNTVHTIKTGDVLSFRGRETGMRTYLGIKYGFNTKEILQSRSWLGSLDGVHRLLKEDELPYRTTQNLPVDNYASIHVNSSYLRGCEIESYTGPEFGKLALAVQQQLFNNKYTLSGSSNRMAVQFEEALVNDLTGIQTAPVMPGTVQLTPSGGLVVLMRDCQTTGGYPRILQLSEIGIQTLAQKVPGDQIQFKKKQ